MSLNQGLSLNQGSTVLNFKLVSFQFQSNDDDWSGNVKFEYPANGEWGDSGGYNQKQRNSKGTEILANFSEIPAAVMVAIDVSVWSFCKRMSQ